MTSHQIIAWRLLSSLKTATTLVEALALTCHPRTIVSRMRPYQRIGNAIRNERYSAAKSSRAPAGAYSPYRRSLSSMGHY
ncbi:hypothetical protein DFH27DRAFT_562762 [Peziza echinospora]|nr:hypothetical protein DFH27DRAFT_562762 [Peziza echinospora]